MSKCRTILQRTLFLGFLSMLFTVSFLTVRAAGEVDPTFNPAAVDVRGVSQYRNAINRIAVQPDGKVIVAGYFQSVGKVYRSGIARLNADGTLDASFNPPTFFSNYTENSVYGGFIFAVAVQNDGKIVVGGDFSTVNGQARPGLARLNSDGTVDAAFNLLNNPAESFVGRVLDLKIADDGRITFVGGFAYPNIGSQKKVIGRVLADGRRDLSFSDSAFSIFYLNRLELLTDGKILVSGYNYSNGSVNRLNGDGTQDSSFPVINFNGSNLALRAARRKISGRREFHDRWRFSAEGSSAF